VINAHLAGRGSYLEVGVRGGATFWTVQARTRIGVDPAPLGRRLAFTARASALVYALGRRSGTHLFRETSDVFFEHRARAMFSRHPIDAALIDGLHAADQAYRDVDNTLQWLAADGIIVMHDCNPPTETASMSLAAARARSDFAGCASGDVWRAVMRLRTRSDISVHVLDTDLGLGIVTRETPRTTLNMSWDEIDALTYHDLAANRAAFLDLRPIS
jgi:hypothetical protein